MNQNKIQEEVYQTLAPDELLDKALYLMLQLTEEERTNVLSKYAKKYGWT